MLCTTHPQASGPWSPWSPWSHLDPNDCGSYCIDHTAASDFLFRPQPGEPQRFLPTGTGGVATWYHVVGPGDWPTWGDGDLRMGFTNGPPGGPPGASGYCDQGATYAGSPNETCGGYRNWGRTDLEAWYLVEEGV